MADAGIATGGDGFRSILPGNGGRSNAQAGSLFA